MLGPRLLGQATDIIVSGVTSGDGIDFGALHRKLTLVAGLYLGSWALAYAQAYILAGVVQRIDVRPARIGREQDPPAPA